MRVHRIIALTLRLMELLLMVLVQVQFSHAATVSYDTCLATVVQSLEKRPEEIFERRAFKMAHLYCKRCTRETNRKRPTKCNLEKCNADHGYFSTKLYECICSHGWTGVRCERSRCGEFGRLEPNGQYCRCDSGYEGGQCQRPRCKNNGQWKNSTCVCRVMFTGADCSLSRCQGDGRPSEDGLSCIDCSWTRTGTFCERSLIVENVLSVELGIAIFSIVAFCALGCCVLAWTYANCAQFQREDYTRCMSRIEAEAERNQTYEAEDYVSPQPASLARVGTPLGSFHPETNESLNSAQQHHRLSSVDSSEAVAKA